MGSRYLKTKILDNDAEFYEFLRKKRGNVKSLSHYVTPILRQPDVSTTKMSTTGGLLHGTMDTQQRQTSSQEMLLIFPLIWNKF
jgi:hypothetical protein